jgi:DNA-binding winged helix-turn-helix (wHTH) protein
MRFAVGGNEIRLKRSEVKILAYLYGRNGCVVAREEVGACVLRFQPQASRAMDTHIAELRKKVPGFISTVHGVGYRFVDSGGCSYSRKQSPGRARKQSPGRGAPRRVKAPIQMIPMSVGVRLYRTSSGYVDEIDFSGNRSTASFIEMPVGRSDFVVNGVVVPFGGRGRVPDLIMDYVADQGVLPPKAMGRKAV